MIDLIRAMNSFLQLNDKQKAIYALLTFPKATRSSDRRKYCYVLKILLRRAKNLKGLQNFHS